MINIIIIIIIIKIYYYKLVKWHSYSVTKTNETTNDTLRWRHNERDSVSNHQPHDCLPNRLFRRRSKKTSKLRVTGLCVGNSGNGEFPAQRASYAENVSIWWRHHDIRCNRRRADRTVFYIVVCRTLEHVSLYHKYKLPDLCTHRYIHGNIFYTRTTPSFKLILVVSLFDLKCIWNIGMSGHMQAYIAMPRQRFLSWKWEYN